MLSLPVWGAWIEIFEGNTTNFPPLSLPVWGAWIEIKTQPSPFKNFVVAPRVGGVD